MRTVYLDSNATTAVVPAVFEAMRPFYSEWFGNPSSPHHMGDKPASAVRDARARVASFLGCADTEVVFTSCGTESNNIAIRGVLDGGKGRHLVTTSVEHSAVMNPAKRLASLGYDVTLLPVDRDGNMSLDELRDSLRDDTALVSVMLANNETGVIFPIQRVAEIVHARGIPLHVDAVQAVGKIPVSSNIELFGRAGVSRIETSPGGDDDAFAYGVGGQLNLTQNDGIRADWTRHDFDSEVDAWSLAYVRKF